MGEIRRERESTVKNVAAIMVIIIIIIYSSLDLLYSHSVSIIIYKPIITESISGLVANT